MKKRFPEWIFLLGISAGLFFVNNTFGQYDQLIWPSGTINLFLSHDPGEAAATYNSLRTRKQRDSLITVRLAEDWTSDIESRSYEAPFWMCGNWEMQLLTNSHKWSDAIYSGMGPLYNDYYGSLLDSIYINRGSRRDMGKLGLPMWSVGVYDTSFFYGHAMTAIPTGNDLTRYDSWNVIQPGNDSTNCQPGEQNILWDCSHFSIGYIFEGLNKHGQLILSGVKVLEFTIRDGIPYLVYNINDDPLYNGTYAPDRKCHLITMRDTIGPVPEFEVKDDSLWIRVIDENFKEGSYIIDSSATGDLEAVTRIALKHIGAAGTTHTVYALARDEFNQTGEDSIRLTIPDYIISGLSEQKIFPGIIRIYPNPAKDIVFLESIQEVPQDLQLKVFSLDGLLISNPSVGIRDGKGIVDFSELKPAIYILQIIQGERVQFEKIVKQQ